jgi:hypothetical protein
MVNTVAMNESKYPCQSPHLPFHFYAEPNVMNAFGRARGSGCGIIVQSGLRDLARGGCAGQF